MQCAERDVIMSQGARPAIISIAAKHPSSLLGLDWYTGNARGAF